MAIFDCATCHNLEPSLTIIMDNGDQYFEKKLCPKISHNAMCYILTDGWQLAWHHGCSYNGVE